jgi:hypothetical protein
MSVANEANQLQSKLAPSPISAVCSSKRNLPTSAAPKGRPATPLPEPGIRPHAAGAQALRSQLTRQTA